MKLNCMLIKNQLGSPPVHLTFQIRLYTVGKYLLT